MRPISSALQHKVGNTALRTDVLPFRSSSPA